MSGYSRRTSTTSTDTTPVAGTGTQTAEGPSNSLLADLLSGKVKLDGEAADYLAQGIQFQKGMKGELVKRLQRMIGSGVDGDFGPMTDAALRKWQRANGLPETGVVDEATWTKLEAGGGLAGLSGEEDFAKMWDAHPHNYMEDSSQDTTSKELRGELGLTAAQAENTCALRMSTMLNRMDGDHAIDVNKALEAGLGDMRTSGLYLARINDPKTEGTSDRAILSAREMWTYLEHHRGPPDLVWPPEGRYSSREEAEQGAKEVEAAVAGKKGMIAFDKIFGYGGSGHVDIFDGPTLSDGDFYPSEQTKIWFVVQ